MITTNDLDYVIIDCGYTDRLVDRLGFHVKKELKNNSCEDGLRNNSRHQIKPIKEKYLSKYSDYIVDEFNDKFVYLHHYSCGSYVIDENESKKVLKILKKYDLYPAGYLCFNNMTLSEAMEYITFLGNIKFCYGVNSANIGDMKIIDDPHGKLLIINIDTESG